MNPSPARRCDRGQGLSRAFRQLCGLAEAELTTYRDLDDDAPDHANSNTAPTAPTEDGDRRRAVPRAGYRSIVLCRAHRHGAGSRTDAGSSRFAPDHRRRAAARNGDVPRSRERSSAPRGLDEADRRLAARRGRNASLSRSSSRRPRTARRRSQPRKRRRSRCTTNQFHRNSTARTSSRHACCAGWWTKPLVGASRGTRSWRGAPQHLLNRNDSLMAGNSNNPGWDMSRASNLGQQGGLRSCQLKRLHCSMACPLPTKFRS